MAQQMELYLFKYNRGEKAHFFSNLDFAYYCENILLNMLINLKVSLILGNTAHSERLITVQDRDLHLM